MRKNSLLLLVLPLLLTGCNFNSNSSSSNEISSGTNENSTPTSETSYSSEEASISKESDSVPVDDEYTFTDFFNHALPIYITMDFTSTALQNLSDYGGDENNSYRHDVYHPCNIEIKLDKQTYTYNSVGVRMKGNTSREYFINNGNFNGSYVNFKVSFNQIFADDPYKAYNDTSLKSRRFLSTIKKLDLKWNKNEDYTFTKEAYADYMLEEEGVMAQKVNLCKVSIKKDGQYLNGYFNIIYNVYETIDKDFLKRRLDSTQTKGNLYKGAWNGSNACDLNTASNYGVEDNSRNQHYVYSLKTNEDNPNHSVLVRAINVINTTGPASSVQSSLEQVVDIPYLLKYSALMWVIGNPDDFRYNKNNTYFYFNSENDKLTLIPYDNDRCFGIKKDWEIDMSYTGPSSWDNAYKIGGGWEGQCEPHLLWRTILNLSQNSYPVVSSWRQTYLEYCSTYANKYLSNSKFQSFTNGFALAPNKNISIGGSVNVSFTSYANNKLEALNY